MCWPTPWISNPHGNDVPTGPYQALPKGPTQMNELTHLGDAAAVVEALESNLAQAMTQSAELPTYDYMWDPTQDEE